MMYGNDMGWGGWVLMTVSVLAFWALVAAVVVALVRSGRNDTRPFERPRERPKDALELLDERFARGEIDETDYHSRRELLTTHR